MRVTQQPMFYRDFRLSYSFSTSTPQKYGEQKQVVKSNKSKRKKVAKK